MLRFLQLLSLLLIKQHLVAFEASNVWNGCQEENAYSTSSQFVSSQETKEVSEAMGQLLLTVSPSLLSPLDDSCSIKEKWTLLLHRKLLQR